MHVKISHGSGKKLPWQKAVDIPPTLAGTLLGGFLPLSHINLWFIERFPPKRIANQKGLCALKTLASADEKNYNLQGFVTALTLVWLKTLQLQPSGSGCITTSQTDPPSARVAPTGDLGT